MNHGMDPTTARDVDPAVLCSRCRLSIVPTSEHSSASVARMCPLCQRPCHEDCWVECGGCGSPSCAPSTQPEPPPQVFEDLPAPRPESSEDSPPLGATSDDVITVLEVHESSDGGASLPPLPTFSPSGTSDEVIEITDFDLDDAPDEDGFSSFEPAPQDHPPPVAEMVEIGPRPTISWDVDPDLPNAAPDERSQNMGPLGRPHSIFGLLFLQLLTCGLYHLAWLFHISEEAYRYAHGRRRMHLPDGRYTLAVYGIPALAIPIFGGALTLLAIQRGELVLDWPFDLPTGAIGLLGVIVPLMGLPFFIAGCVHAATLPRRMALAEGVPSGAAGSPGWRVLWLLVPGLGLLLFWATVQARLNRFWNTRASG